MSSRGPAPGALEIVRSFINTADLEGATDVLDSPTALRAFFVEHGLAADADPVDDTDLAVAVQVREGIRALLDANCCGEGPDPRSIEVLNRTAARGALTVRFAPDGATALEPRAEGADAAIARILAIVYSAMTEGTWQRMKACKRDRCRWAFYDRSKNLSSKWCSMEVCGNREKVGTYRRRTAHA